MHNNIEYRSQNILVFFSALVVSLSIIFGYVVHILIALIFTITIAIIVKYPKRNIILFIILLFPLLPFHVGLDMGKPIPVIKIQRILIFCLVIFWLTDRGRVNIITSIKSYPLWPITGYLALILFGVNIIHGLSISGINNLFSFLIEDCLLAFIVYDYFIKESEQKLLLIVLCVSGCLAAILGVVEYITGFNWNSILPAYREEVEFALNQQERLSQVRIKGAFTHAINFGAALSIFSACLLILFMTTTKKSSRSVIIIFLCIIFACCYFTLSRAPLLMFMMIILFMLLWKNKKVLIIFSLLMIIINFQPIYLDEFKNDIKQLVYDTIKIKGRIGNSTYARIDQYHRSLKYIKERPFFGRGNIVVDDKMLSKTLDNYYLLYILKNGFVGFLALLVLFTVIIKNTFIITKQTRSDFQKNFGVGYLSVTLSILMIWGTVSLTSYMYLFWIMCGMAMRMSKIDT
jgi:O-antigen ligase